MDHQGQGRPPPRLGWSGTTAVSAGLDALLAPSATLYLPPNPCEDSLWLFLSLALWPHHPERSETLAAAMGAQDWCVFLPF